MTSVARISSGASAANRSKRRPRKPTASPITVPPAVISTNLSDASPIDGAPLAMVASTAVKTATPVPSLNRLSPSRMAERPDGAFIWRISVTTAIGSVAARMAPSSMLLAQLKPRVRWVNVPISTTVSATPAVARSPIGASRRRSSGRSRVSAASKINPGTKARRMTSEPTWPSWPPGSNPMTTPAAASTTGEGTIRARLDTRPSTVARAPTRIRRSRNLCCGLKGPPRTHGASGFLGFSHLEAHSVAGGFHLDAQPLGQVRGELPRMRAPHGHAVVGEDGELGFCLADDALGVVEAQVWQLGAALHQHRVDHHHIGFVLLRDAVVEGGIGDPAEPIAETETVGLDLVTMPRRGRELDAIDVVGGLRLEPHDLLRKFAQVLQHDRVVVEGVGWAEQASAMRETAFGHRLDHHVHVAAVIEVAVAHDDGVELAEVDLPLRVLDDGAGPRVEGDARRAVLDVKATGGGKRLGDHEPSAGGAHESQFHVSATSLRTASPLPPKYLSYSSSTLVNVSISSAGLSSRIRTIRGKRSAKPLVWRLEC